MFAGDGAQILDAQSYDINAFDKTLWESLNGVFLQYVPADFNLDGDVNGIDKSFWSKNNGISSRVPR